METAASPLRRAVRAHRRAVVGGSLLVVVHQACEVAVPVLVGVVVDRAVATGDAAAMARWTAVLALLFVCLSAAGCIGLYVEQRVVNDATHWARTRLAERLLHPGGGLDDTRSGGALSLTTVETARLGEGVGAVIVVVAAVGGILAGAAVLLATSVTLGLAVVIAVPVVVAVVRVASAPLTTRAAGHQAAVGAAAGVAGDLLRGLRVLKGLGAAPAGAAAYRRASGAALQAALQATRMRAVYTGVTRTASGVLLLVVAWIGGRQALSGDITVGELVAAVGLTQFLVGPFLRLAYGGEVLAHARAASARIAGALQAPPAVSGGGAAPSLAPPLGLAVRGLWHGTLAGLDLRVAPGEVVGLATVRPSDAVALVACLDRTAEPAAGTVAVTTGDVEVDLATLDLDLARRTVTVAHHAAPLFEDRIEAEVASVAADPERVRPAIAAAAADEVATALAEAGERDLGEAGTGLSGGQRQRVALARALATDAPVLVLHEPTTAVDAATEHRVAAGVRALRRGRTTVLVTTSPTLLAAADRVVLVEGGRAVAEATHGELARDHDTYRAAVLS